jgi:hypothetical protein
MFSPLLLLLALTAAMSAGLGVRPQMIVQAAPSRYQDAGRMESHDDLLVRVERQVPGFGGMFIDRQGRLTVYLLDRSRLGAARAAIEAIFGPDSIPASGVRALQGDYVISQLKSWTEIAAAVLTLPGVTAVDLDEAGNRVAIGIDDKSRASAVERALSGMPIPRRAVTIQVTGSVHPVR